MNETAILSNPKTIRNRIYVGNINLSCTSDEITNIFSAYGKILGISRKGPTFCFVEFQTADEAQRAIFAANGTKVGGRALIVKNVFNNSQKRKADNEDDQPMNKSEKN